MSAPRIDLSPSQSDLLLKPGRFSLKGAKTSTIEALIRKGMLTEGLRLSPAGKALRAQRKRG